jgi:pimeloyl-ACP methyl ester carboxylesterase
MDRFVSSSDGARIRYEVTGNGPTALLFIHGSMGSARWWDAQRDHFAARYTVVQPDLPGHGGSDHTRPVWSARQYAEDIKAVAGQVACPNVVLVGHSMAGAYALEASLIVPATRAIILVDTLKDLEHSLTFEQANELLLESCRRDFRSTVETLLPQHLFVPSTPPSIRARLQAEFLRQDGNTVAKALEPLYRMDIRAVARRVAVPVRAINSDAAPTNSEHNRRHLRDYDHVVISGTGHYPMLERPEEFNRILDELLQDLPIPS